MQTTTGWLEISTAGFASFNQARPPGHLVKELVQNSFDAIGAGLGVVHLDYRSRKGELLVECRDTGDGMQDLSAIRDLGGITGSMPRCSRSATNASSS